MRTFLNVYRTYKSYLNETVGNSSIEDVEDDAISSTLSIEIRDRIDEYRKVSDEDIKKIDWCLKNIEWADAEYYHPPVDGAELPDFWEELWKKWKYYERKMGDPLWPMETCGCREGLENLRRVILSIQGKDNFLNPDDWSFESDCECDDPYGRWTTWGEQMEYWCNILNNYPEENRKILGINESSKPGGASLEDLEDDAVAIKPLAYEEFDDLLIHFIEKNRDRFNRIKMAEPFTFYDFDDKIIQNDRHIFTLMSEVRKYELLDGEFADLCIKFTIGQEYALNKNYFNKYKIRVDILFGEGFENKKEYGNCCPAYNFYIENGKLKKENSSYKSKATETSFKLLADTQKIINAYLTALEELPVECLSTLGQVYKTFRAPSIGGDASCLDDEQKILNHLNKFGFGKTVDKMINGL